MITKEQAMTCGYFYHKTLRNRDGSALRCRANGKCQTWKREPGRFRLPVKYGYRECFYITERNASEWLIYDPTEQGRREIAALVLHVRNAKRVGLSPDTPPEIVHDALIDAGLLPG